MKKYILSAAFALCMMWIFLPSTAFAEGGNDIELTKEVLENNYKTTSIGVTIYMLPSGNYKLGEI